MERLEEENAILKQNIQILEDSTIVSSVQASLDATCQLNVVTISRGWYRKFPLKE